MEDSEEGVRGERLRDVVAALGNIGGLEQELVEEGDRSIELDA